MDIRNRQNKQPESIADLYKKAEKPNPFLLTQRQHLIQRLNDLLYKTQRNVVTDDQVSEILKLISHI
jgi:hypothetical protein